MAMCRYVVGAAGGARTQEVSSKPVETNKLNDHTHFLPARMQNIRLISARGQHI